MQSIEERLLRLERSARRWRFWFCLLVMAGSAAILGGQTAEKPSIVTCNELRIVDESGAARGRWVCRQDGNVSIELLNQDSHRASHWMAGNGFASIAVGSDACPEGSISIGSMTGSSRIDMAAYDNGTAVIRTGGWTKPQIVLGADQEKAIIEVRARDGRGAITIDNDDGCKREMAIERRP